LLALLLPDLEREHHRTCPPFSPDCLPPLTWPRLGVPRARVDLTLTIPKGTKPAANSQLFVLEYYYGSQYGNTETISEAVKF
jgi:hypothetical protein